VKVVTVCVPLAGITIDVVRSTCGQLFGRRRSERSGATTATAGGRVKRFVKS